MSAGSDYLDPPECLACEDGVHDLCEDHECPCDRAEHPDRPDPLPE